MNMDMYDDMMGLEFGDYEGIFNMAQMKESLIATTAGGGAILLTTWGFKMVAEKIDLAGKVKDPLARSALTSGAAFLLAIAAGRALGDYNQTAAIGVAGGLGGFAMANLIDAAISRFTNQARILGTGLGEDELSGDDESLLTGYDGMSALAALEATGVTSAPGAFADPSVTNEALMGFEGTVVQQESLGAYSPYLA